MRLAGVAAGSDIVERKSGSFIAERDLKGTLFAGFSAAICVRSVFNSCKTCAAATSTGEGRMGVVSRLAAFSKKKPHLTGEREAGQHTDLILQRLGKTREKGVVLRPILLAPLGADLFL
jgi:hypothetical protein